MTAVSLHRMAKSDLRKSWEKTVFNKTGLDKTHPLISCLFIILEKMDWHGAPRLLVEAFPHDATKFDVEDLRDTLARIGFQTIAVETSLKKLPKSLAPCLFIDKHDHPYVVVEEDHELVLKDGIQAEPQKAGVIRRYRGTYYIVKPLTSGKNDGGDRTKVWMRTIFSHIQSMLLRAISVTLFINVLSLAVPISIMLIYDQVISKEDKSTLLYVMSGVLLAAFFEISFRVTRAKIQAYIGARIDYIVGGRVFEQILHLPPQYTERSPVGGQVTKMREFENLREFFTGPLASILFDLPFIVVFLAVIGALGGPLIVVPLVLATLYVLLGFVVIPEIRTRMHQSGKVRSDRYSFLVETFWSMRSIKQRGAEDTWYDRFKKISVEAAWANMQATRFHQIVQNIAQTIMMAAGVATLVAGVFLVMNGDMSLGALVAIMMLVWRVLTPLQVLFNMANRIEQMRLGVTQLRELLRYKPEQEMGDAPESSITFKGHLEFNRVSMRYTQDSNPAMLGVSFSAEPGEMVGVIGNSGSGKSTLAKLILGLYRPQAGAITLDSIDIRQLRPITLRQTLAYLPQRNHVFPGTLYENIILSDPTASMTRVRAACRMAGILKNIEALPHGFKTEFREGLQAQVPQDFLIKIGLARVFLRDAPVVILDEPAGSMSEKDEVVFLESLELLRRNKKTIIMVTQRPSHMRLCDKLILLNEGQIEAMDIPEKVLNYFFKSAAQSASQKKEATNG